MLLANGSVPGCKHFVSMMPETFAKSKHIVTHERHKG